MAPKDNFAQTMKELLGGTSGKDEMPEEKKSVGVPLSSFSQPAKTEDEGTKEESTPQDAAKESDTKADKADLAGTTSGKTLADFAQTSYTTADETALATQEEESTMQDYTSNLYSSTTTTTEETTTSPFAQPLPANDAVGSVTVIAAGTKIVGDIDTDGALCIEGSVKGNVRVGTKLDLNGKVLGDIEAEDIEIISTAVKGNVVARNTVHMDKDTTIVGDVSAKNAEIDGKIKGNLTVSERAHIKVDSILMGNLVSGTVNIEEGAMLKGDISITNIQSENVTIVEPDFDINIKSPRGSKPSSSSVSSTSSSSNSSNSNNRSKL